MQTNSWHGHGTDRALVGGVLGMNAYDPQIRDSLQIAKERGIEVSFEGADLGDVHPNTVQVIAQTSDGKTTSLIGSSIGGANIEIIEINGTPAKFSGKYPAVVINHTDRLGIIVAGRGAEDWRNRFAVPAYPQGYVQGAAAMRELYRAADVLAMPSMADNLPNTIVEAMACGVPCAGFDVGGLPQLIGHGTDGYLARLRDADDLARGIEATLLSPRLDALRRAAREKAVHSYSETAVARQYARVYEQAIEETSNR